MQDSIYMQQLAEVFRRLEALESGQRATVEPDPEPCLRRRLADPCRLSILRALHQSTGRLNKQELIDAMAANGDEFSDRKVDYTLSELKDEGILDNPKSAGKHLGYGFSWQK